MGSIALHKGKVAGMDRVNVDTDQIIPKQFLKRIERTGFGQYVFFDWRFNNDGTENENFELNRPENKGATILVAGDNFGCGSSREHAPWALKDYGFEIVIAPSFADIFYNNCLKNGMLPIRLDGGVVKNLIEKSQDADFELTIDLEKQVVIDSENEYSFAIDPYWKEMLINGWDEIDVTLKLEEAIASYENNRKLG